MTSSRSLTRRQLLQAAGAAVAVPYLVPGSALGADGAAPASEVVNIGIIGAGGRARAIAATCGKIPQPRIAAVADCFRPNAEAFSRGKWPVYEDFRQMIEKEKLQGVMVETPTHPRAWITAIAMQMGADVYIEKPMCLTIAEGRYLVNAARRFGRVTQVGTQQRSMPLNNWVSDLVKNGGLGKIHTVLAPNFVGPDIWKDQPEKPMPKGGSETWWDQWTNQAVFRPYHPELHRGWDRWWDYDGGGRCYGVTGWGTHSYDQINRALGTDATGPVEIWLEEPVTVQNTGKYDAAPPPDAEGETGAAYRGLSKPVIGPRAKVSMRFASGTVVKLHLDGDRGPGLGAIFVGEKGKVELNRNKAASNPKDILLAADNPGADSKEKDENRDHVANWIECIKSRKPCNADIEIGQRSSTLCYLVNIVRAVGEVDKKLQWDPVAERFTNSPEANKHLSRERRKGFDLPALS